MATEKVKDAQTEKVKDVFLFNQPVMDRFNSKIVYQKGDEVPEIYLNDTRDFIKRGLVDTK